MTPPPDTNAERPVWHDLDEATATLWWQALCPDGPVSVSPAYAVADAVRDARLQVRFVGISTGTARLLHSFHLQPFAQGQALGVVTPYGYGGPVLSACDEASRKALRGAWQAGCTARGWIAQFTRFHPLLDNASAQARVNRDTVVVATWAYHPNSLARRKLKRASAAQTQVRWSQTSGDWAAYGPFYRAAMTAMGADPRYHFSDAYFLRLARLGCAWLCVVAQGEVWLSAGVYLLGADIAEYHLGASSAAGFTLGSPYVMQDAAVARAQSQGCAWLYLGGGTTPEVDNSLLFYKACFSSLRRPFKVAANIHDEPRYWALAARQGYAPERPPPQLLFD